MLPTAIPGASPSPALRTQPLARIALLVLLAAGAAVGADAQIADFSMAPNAPVPGAPATFSYTGTCPGTLTSLIWEFGDGSSLTVDPNVSCNATHAYATGSVYRVRLTVLPSGQTLSKDLGVRSLTNGQSQLNPAFSWIPTTPTPNQVVSFTDETTPVNSVGQWTWDFDDGTRSFLRNPEKAFAAGTHGVRLTVSNQAVTRQATIFVEVQLPALPIAAFSYSPTNPTPGSVVSFFDQSTETPTAWSWNFGDPTSSFPNTSVSKNPTHRFTKAGSYTVRLVASNAGGSSAPHTEVVVVGEAGLRPVASFSYSPTSPVSGDQVLFTDTSTGAPTSWSWDFDDPSSGGSNTSALQNPSHVFSEARTYDVTLRASNSGGTSDPATEAVPVAEQEGNCHSNVNTLCLQDNRFSVTTTYRTRENATGPGSAVRLTADSGYFYFFDSNNVEIVTKVLRACSNPFNSYWVFASGLTNVEVTLTVTDTENGTVRTYHNPLGTPFQPIQDTAAFATCP